MSLDRQQFLCGHLARLTSDSTKGAIALMAAGPPCNLRHFRYGQASCAMSIKFGKTCKGNVLNIKIETHSDSISRHQIIDLSRLEHRHLCVARARG